jgi:OOP family OmpA-OmpF porin
MQAVQVHLRGIISQWQPFVSLEPALLTTREKQLLHPPETVTPETRRKRYLYAINSASHPRIIETRKRVQCISSITHFHWEKLIDSDLRQLKSSHKPIKQQNSRIR